MSIPAPTLERLAARARLLARLRDFFAVRGFWEVETPLVAAEVIPELHIEPRQVRPESADEPPQWLQASPELHMKRLMTLGCDAVYQVTRSFRGREFGELHRPEFTLVEWYRRGDGMQAGMDLLADLAAELLDADAVDRTTYADAFRAHAGVDPLTASIAELRDAARRLEAPLPDALPPDDRDEWLNLLLALRVEPRLGQRRPEILYHYPDTQAALARIVAGGEGQPVAARFELYFRGVELANGYDELTDPDALEKRLTEANRRRQAAGRAALPMPESLLAAMRDPGLPACSGCALGFDRLAMAATGAASLAEVRFE